MGIVSHFASDSRAKVAAGVGAAVLAVGTGALLLRRKQRQSLRRPYEIKELNEADSVDDAKDELGKVIMYLQDEVVKPIDDRLPGRPFQSDFLVFPFTPMVLVVGNHSAGKSTFINNLLGLTAQETAVAPTDDGFTVLERHSSANDMEDGPTLLGCPDNRPFKELHRFGQSFWGNLKRKRLLLKSGAVMPYGLQLVDTPGMIDMPISADGEGGGRGYNFLEVVRWFAKRSDLILLLFDPERPGTCRETLDVLTKSLAGLNHKFLIILNKVDSVKNSVDFARTYGTLGWALSKVIPRKDLPMIYTMYNDLSVDGETHNEADDANRTQLPLDRFRQKREEVIAEVLRARIRHWDNVITGFEETLRDVEMIAIVTSRLQRKVSSWRLAVQTTSAILVGLPALLAAQVFGFGDLTLRKRVIVSGCMSYGALCCGMVWFIKDYLKSGELLQIDLDYEFETAYSEQFIHSDVEDLRGRWLNVKPKINNMLRSVPTAARLANFKEWEIAKIKEAVGSDLVYLRQLARVLRKQDSAIPPVPGAHPSSS